MEKITVSFTGDVLIHQRIYARAKLKRGYDFSAQFKTISPEIRVADVSCTNLESIAAGERYGISGYPNFNAPEELLDGLKEAGFTLLNVANNHMLDKGEDALLASLRNIEKRGLTHTGASTDASVPDSGVVFDIRGTKIGFLSYTDGSKMRTREIERAQINYFAGEYQSVRMVRRVLPIKRRLAELRQRADAIVLQLHFGEEYLRYPSAFQRELIASLCEGEVDAIIAHHPHVLQPAEWVKNSRGKGVLVMYSLGNFLTGQLGIHRQIGGIFSFDLQVGHKDLVEVSEPELLLTYVDPRRGYQVRKLKDSVSEYEMLDSAGYKPLHSGQLYENVLEHARTYMPSLTVS